MAEAWLTYEQAATLGIDQGTLRRWAIAGKVGTRRVDRVQVFLLSDIQREAQAAAPIAAPIAAPNEAATAASAGAAGQQAPAQPPPATSGPPQPVAPMVLRPHKEVSPWWTFADLSNCYKVRRSDIDQLSIDGKVRIDESSGVARYHIDDVFSGVKRLEGVKRQ